jgi:signal transduction histidine kinase
MSKLLSKPFKAFTLYALLILASSIPAYYFIINYIWKHELDENNRMIRDQVIAGLERTALEGTDLQQFIVNWLKIQPGINLSPAPSTGISLRDSISTVTKMNSSLTDPEMERFRILSSGVNINGQSYILTVETSIERADETFWTIAIITFFFFALMGLGFVFLNRVIAGRIWQPFRNTLDKMRVFDLAKNKTIDFEPTDIEEFSELNQAVHKLLEHNISAYNQQKVFIENASHELQTPLAVLKSKLDLLIQDTAISGESAKVLDDMNVPLSRMARINKNLVLLAKIENSQFEDTEPLQLSEILDESLNMLSDYIEDKAINVDVRREGGPVIRSNRTLIEILLNNLLINAIRHIQPGGAISIIITDRNLVIRNTGSKPLNPDMLFKRFSISSKESASSGLGLAITKEICIRYGWELNYDFAELQHVFTITF